MKYIKYLLSLIISIILSTLIFGSLSYFNIINENVLLIIQLLILYITLFYISYNLGRSKEQKGYIEGIIFGLIISFFFLIIKIIFKDKINLYNIIYFISIILVSITGSIIGINKKTKA